MKYICINKCIGSHLYTIMFTLSFIMEEAYFPKVAILTYFCGITNLILYHFLI